MSSSIDSTRPTSHPIHIRILFCVVVGAVGVFGLCTLLYNFPDSTVKSRIDPVVNTVVQPWFEQDWHLFAPTPSTTNTHLMVTARIQLSNGSIGEPPAFDVQYPIEDLVKSSHVLPTKLPGVTLAAQQRMADYAMELAAISHAPAAEQPSQHADLDRRYQPMLDALGRFMSRCAQDRFGSAHILAVRGTFTSTPMTPFSARDAENPPTLPTKTIITTSWDPFVPDVAK
ncbi:DUF5819 family protein [Mycobacterium sp. BMJ-28]